MARENETFPSGFDNQCELVPRLYIVLLDQTYGPMIAPASPAWNGDQKASFVAKYPAFNTALVNYNLSQKKDAGLRQVLQELLTGILIETRFFVEYIADYYRRNPANQDVPAILQMLQITVSLNPRTPVTPSQEAPNVHASVLEGHPDTLHFSVDKNDKGDQRGKKQRLFEIELFTPDGSQKLGEIHITTGHRKYLYVLHDAAGCRVKITFYYLSARGDRSVLSSVVELYMPGIFDPASIARHLGEHGEEEK